MQRYLNVGCKETRYLNIEQQALMDYQVLFDDASTTTIPLLFFARYWSKFELFQPFIGEAITLVETNVNQPQAILYEASIEATMTYMAYKKIKGFERFQFELALPHDNTIQQTFVKRVGH
ncbi:hypothetical protein [Staphylococcus coagulans]|uniref:hypothetical protein n=1 Tax=Staphylococcus coagulans TaxID=74706 RepID=UPI001F4BF621|nr:hypothetical protein [Staphylococcus coagulans]UNB45934.1 hypothetical protein KM141_10745 [Staphylococcus coagulans]